MWINWNQKIASNSLFGTSPTVNEPQKEQEDDKVVPLWVFLANGIQMSAGTCLDKIHLKAKFRATKNVEHTQNKDNIFMVLDTSSRDSA